MRLCLTCRNASPGDAAYCAGCSRSFGGRRCPKGHLSPPDARCCVACGVPEKDLSEATGYLPLGCLAPGIVWGCAFLALRAVWAHRDTLLGYAAGLARWGVEAAFGSTPERLACALLCALCRVAFWTALLCLLPGQVGKSVRQAVGAFLAATFRAAVAATRFVLRLPAKLARR